MHDWTDVIRCYEIIFIARNRTVCWTIIRLYVGHVDWNVMIAIWTLMLVFESKRVHNFMNANLRLKNFIRCDCLQKDISHVGFRFMNSARFHAIGTLDLRGLQVLGFINLLNLTLSLIGQCRPTSWNRLDLIERMVVLGWAFCDIVNIN